jgi:hypothetical protein
VKYNNGKNEAFAIKSRSGYIPIIIDDLITVQFKDVVAEDELEINALGRVVTKDFT